jgi:hypothetical protein
VDVSIYHKKWIVPAKCGSRYLDKAFGVTEQDNFGFSGINNEMQLNGWRNTILDSPYTKIAAQSDKIFQFWVLPITHIVLRNPLSHLLSALHTDLWGHLDEPTRNIGLVKGNLHLEEILLKYTKDGTGHWSPHLYFDLYMLLQKRPDIKVVPIESLTELLNESGFELEYVPSEYNFEKVGGPSRDEIINWVKTEYPSIWKRIWERYELDVKWANRITENVGLPKIKKRKRKLI